jgi:catechol 2,3-dioxygenase-like lactoylglutathione lyase family enzyme
MAADLNANNTGHGSMDRAAASHSIDQHSGMLHPQPLIAVTDVKAARAWYGRLLGCHSGMPGSPNHPHRQIYDRLVRDGRLILQLHAWDAEDHPNLKNRGAGTPGHGVLLWFETDQFDEIVKRARDLGAEFLLEPHHNILHMECWIRDPDGYVIVLASPDEEMTRTSE